jgi:hypothetical protein
MARLRSRFWGSPGEDDVMSRVDPSEGVSHEIIQDYLLHHGYADTLRAFEQSTGLTSSATAQPME